MGECIDCANSSMCHLVPNELVNVRQSAYARMKWQRETAAALSVQQKQISLNTEAGRGAQGDMSVSYQPVKVRPWLSGDDRASGKAIGSVLSESFYRYIS